MSGLHKDRILTDAEMESLMVLWHDYELADKLKEFFYKRDISVDEEWDFLPFKLKHELEDRDWIENDKYHTIKCRSTGFEFELCLHIVAEMIELRDAAQTFRLVYTVRTEELKYENSAGEVETSIPRSYEWMQFVDGDMKALVKFALALKMTEPEPSDWRGFELI